MRINHIGSSAVEGLIAKPIVDILLEMADCCPITRMINDLHKIGWRLMLQEHSPVVKLAFNKGYTPGGVAQKVYHLHVRYFGNWDELYFRDYLIAHPDVAQAYGTLKMSLLKDFEHNCDGYTQAKSAFIMRYSEIAKTEFPDRYHP